MIDDRFPVQSMTMEPVFSSDPLDQARAALSAGDLRRAEAFCRQAIEQNSDNLKARYLLGAVLLSAGRAEEAAVEAERCIAAQPRESRFHTLLGRARTHQGRFDEALARFQEGVKLNPRDTRALAAMGDVLHRTGERDRALMFIKGQFLRGFTDSVLTEVYARLLFAASEYDDAIDVAARHADDSELDFQTRRSLLSTMAKSHDRNGDYDAAFDCCQRGHDIIPQQFDESAYHRRVDSFLTAFDAATFATIPRARHDSELPVFIVGMPRCGSTLVEQILHAHPRAHGAGELPMIGGVVRGMAGEIGSSQPYPACLAELAQDDVDRIGSGLIDELQALAPDAHRVIDKQLANHRHLPLLQLLAPRARVIHCRRDPLDTCVSCFMSNLSPITHPYTTDLRRLGLAYRSYLRVMDRWRELLDLPILEVDYEELVADQEGVSRAIVEFCGLEWDDACLRFYDADRAVLTASTDQVNKPIYASSVGRHLRFDAHLGPLKAALGE